MNAKSAARLVAAVAMLALASVATLAVAPVAQAKPYKVYACATPSGKPIWLNNSSVSHWARWTSASYQSFSTAFELCGSNKPLELHMGTPGAAGGAYGLGKKASWQVSLPSSGGLPVTSVDVRRSVKTTWGNDHGATAEFRVVARRYGDSGEGSRIESCAASHDCQFGDDRYGNNQVNAANWQLPSDTYALELFVHCFENAEVGGCALTDLTRVRAAFYMFAFNIEDSTPPTKLQGAVSGSLTQDAAARGTRSLEMSATDFGSGIYELRAMVNGEVVSKAHGERGGTCARYGEASVPDYGGAFAPCAPELSHRFDLDTTKLVDGEHKLRVEAVDAADNVTVLHEQTFTVENVPAPANLTLPGVKVISGEPGDLRVNDKLGASNGVWTGADLKYGYQWQRSADGVTWGNIGGETTSTYEVQPPDVGSYLRVRVTATNREGSASAESPQSAKVKSGAIVAGPDRPTSPSDERDPQLVVDREQRTVEVGYGAKIVVTGRLVDADGEPIANASVDVFEQLVVTAAPWSRIDRVVTDSQGGYVFRPATTASRRLRFAFADQRDSAKYRATREVLVSVRARMTISAKRHVVSPRGTIRLRGRLTVDQLPKTGTWVEVQVLDAGVWRTIATRRTSSKGLWTFKHRLRQSSGITFKFRSRLRVIADVPSAEAKSLPVKVRIR